MWGFVGKIGSTDTGTDNDTENSVTAGTDNRYSNRVLTKGLIWTPKSFDFIANSIH